MCSVGNIREDIPSYKPQLMAMSQKQDLEDPAEVQAET